MLENTTLKELEEWYFSHCNGDWEHQSGIEIKSLDNPGSAINVNLEGTELENTFLEEYRDKYENETDWMICRKKDEEFQAFGGPYRLEDMVRFFLKWAQNSD